VSDRLRVVIADDERPARTFLADLLAGFGHVELAGQAANGPEAVECIERLKPDLALLDLQMPELDGLGVVKLLKQDCVPLVAFVTAFDEYAVKAFELNAIDYLLKPVSRTRLRETLDRAEERLDRPRWRQQQAAHLKAAGDQYEAEQPRHLERIPVRKRDQIVLVPVDQVACVVAEGELLHITTHRNERHTISYRLKDLEARLDPARFVRLSRGAIANLKAISSFAAMPGGTYLATLLNRQEIQVSRSQARALRDQLLRL
jgi:two-component system LytT family response regulator